MRILYLEDNPADVELSRAVLEKDGLKYEMTVVDTREDYVAALEAGGYDLILADYHLPSFDGMGALEIAREKYSWLPFIFVSGMMGEEIATESLKRGATDYVLKERLARLPGSMRRALVEAEERRRLRNAEAEREKLLEELSVQHQQLTEVVRQMPAGVIIVEAPSGKLIMGNGQVAQIWRHEFSPSINLEEFKAGRGFHPDGRPYQSQEWPLARSIRAGEMVTNEEIEIRRGDDTRGALSINSAPIRDGEGRIVAGVVTFFDITERKQVERKLREQAEMLDLAHDAIFAWEMDGAISYWNRAAEEIYGYAREEAVGRVSHELLETEAVEDMDAILDSLRLSGRWQGELRHRTKDGREIVVESRMTLVERNGHRLVLETNRDITERKRAEQERERLLESENAARREAEHANHAKDEFLALLSHELRTPLTPMLGWIRILRRRQVRPEDHDSALEKIERSVESEIKLVNDLLDVSRIITGKMTLNLRTLDFCGIVSAAVEVARSSAEAKVIDLVVETGKDEARCFRRPRPVAAGGLEPGLERDQIHPAGRARGGAAGARRRPAGTNRQRHRPGNQPGVSCRTFSSAFARPILRSRARMAGLAWDSRLPSAWWSCTTGASTRRAKAKAEARRSPSNSHSRSTIARRPPLRARSIPATVARASSAPSASKGPEFLWWMTTPTHGR